MVSEKSFCSLPQSIEYLSFTRPCLEMSALVFLSCSSLMGFQEEAWQEDSRSSCNSRSDRRVRGQLKEIILYTMILCMSKVLRR